MILVPILVEDDVFMYTVHGSLSVKIFFWPPPMGTGFRIEY
jgi:hypothetical protein